MKKFNTYFSCGCIAYSVVNFITILMHFIDKKFTIEVSSEIKIIAIIIVIAAVDYIMKDLIIKEGILHLILEFIISVVLVCAIGIPTKLINIQSSVSVAAVFISVLVINFIIDLSMYISVRKDEKEINEILKMKREE